MGAQQIIKFCFGPILRRAHRDDETADEFMRKELMIPMAAVILILNLYFLVQNSQRGVIIGMLQCAFQSTYSAGVIIYVVSTQTMSQLFTEISIVILGLGSVLMSDLRTYAIAEYYTGAVVVMDSFLLTNSRQWVVGLSRNIFVAYLIFLTAEQAVQFGAFAALPRMSTYDPPDESEKKGVSVGLALLFNRLFVFLTDFAMTKHFAEGLRREKEQISMSIEVAHQVAQRLVHFDLDGGEQLVEANGDQLPDELYEVLCGLLKNLKTYRPYLPQSCLPNECKAASGSDSSSESSQATVSTQQSDRITVASLPSSVGRRKSKGNYIRQVGGELQRRQVSLAALNLHEFIMSSRRAGAARLSDFYGRFLSHVMLCCREANGQCELVSGDHIMCTFNAARPLAMHRLAGTRFAVAAVKGLSTFTTACSVYSGTTMSVAVCGGEAQCGPLGCEGLVRYAIIGNVASWVHSVERVASTRKATVLVDQSIRGQVEHSYHLRLICAHYSKLHNKKMLLWMPTSEKFAAVEEWMYQIESMQDVWTDHNMVMQALLEEDLDAARSLIDRLDLSCHENIHLHRACTEGNMDPWSQCDHESEEGEAVMINDTTPVQ